MMEHNEFEFKERRRVVNEAFQNMAKAKACHDVCEDKTRRFVFNEEGVYESLLQGYDRVDASKFVVIHGRHGIGSEEREEYGLTEFQWWVSSLRYAHGVVHEKGIAKVAGELVLGDSFVDHTLMFNKKAEAA